MLQKSSVIISLITAFFFGAVASNAQTQAINVSVSQAKIERGETLEVTVNLQTNETVQALLLKPSVGAENLKLNKISEGIYRAKIEIGKNFADGLYVIHVFTGEKENPSTVGKASFRVGNIVQDFFIANYLDKQNPADDLDNYLKSFRRVGGNFLVAHNLIISSGAFYPSKIAKTNVEKHGAENDLVELLLNRADREGFSVLLSVAWDTTRNSPYKDRMKEIKSIISELYALYRHHPSLAGFYSWQEGSGTYYAPFIREFSEYVKNLDKGLLTACAPHIDDPLLASYLSVIEELDIMIYQGAVMASYRPDNRKKYPIRRVHDFSALGAGAKRLQNKITLTHVELFAYMEKLQSKDFLTASPEDIYKQILSAATVTDTDGISLFAYHAHVYEPLKKFKQVEKSLEAVEKGLNDYQLVTSKVSKNRNPFALYIPYSDFIIERWSNYFLPALDDFRALGVPVDILPYAPRMDESIYPYYPIHHNPQVLERLLKEKTILILTNVSGFQQTDSDLIKAFVERGGVIVAFGKQIPFGRSFERRDLFGGEEFGEKIHTGIKVKNPIGSRAAKNEIFKFAPHKIPSWKAGGANVVAEFEDGSAAVLSNAYGKGTIITILPDANFAVRNLPGLTRDALNYALKIQGNNSLIDIIGVDENFDSAITYTDTGFRLAIVNHTGGARRITLIPAGRKFVCRSQSDKSTGNFSIQKESSKLNIAGGDFQLLECRFDKK